MATNPKPNDELEQVNLSIWRCEHLANLREQTLDPYPRTFKDF